MKDTDIKYIRALVERYFDGSATKEETDVLRRFVADADCIQITDRQLLADLELAKALDGYCAEYVGSRSSEAPVALTARIERHIDRLAADERRRAFRKHLWSSVAALFVLAVLAVGFIIRRQSENTLVGAATVAATADEQILKIEIPECPSFLMPSDNLFAFADNGGNELTVYLPGMCAQSDDDVVVGFNDVPYFFDDFETCMYIEPDDIIEISI